MRIHALLIAVALAAAGSAYAASDTGSNASAPAKHRAGASHKARTHMAKHKSAHHAKSSHMATHHAKASSTRHMGAERHDMSASRTTPDTDLSARDRQNRIDDAYNKWKSNKG